MVPQLIPVPITLRDANAFVKAHHRHSGVLQGCKFAIGIADPFGLRGVAICGRPCRMLQNGSTAEIARVCTDGVRNGCTMLYSRCIQILRLMGYKRIVTYTLRSETGHTLKLSGFKPVAVVRAKDWDTPSRRRLRRAPSQLVERVRWEWESNGGNSE